MGDVIKFTNSTMLNTDGTLNEEGKEEALQHLDKCVKLMQQRIADEEIDGALTLLFKNGELVEDVMAGNIKSTSLVFVLEYIKYQVLTGADSFTEEITEDD
tara:strand:+ start:1020 stop:1322 length:303 start_codon:yes stop_codon:yes gene_type:complete